MFHYDQQHAAPMNVQHSFGGKKTNFITYREKGSKITVCSESSSNV